MRNPEVENNLRKMCNRTLREREFIDGFSAHVLKLLDVMLLGVCNVYFPHTHNRTQVNILTVVTYEKESLESFQ